MNTSVTELQVVEVRSQSSNPVGTVIWLHGLGADGQRFPADTADVGAQTRVEFRLPGGKHAPGGHEWQSSNAGLVRHRHRYVDQK